MFNFFKKNIKENGITDDDCPYKVKPQQQKYSLKIPKEDIDNANMELNSKFQDQINKYILEITSQREEILKAFVAKYGFQPDEVEQVEEITDNGFRWHVRKREVND